MLLVLDTCCNTQYDSCVPRSISPCEVVTMSFLDVLRDNSDLRDFRIHFVWVEERNSFIPIVYFYYKDRVVKTVEPGNT